MTQPKAELYEAKINNTHTREVPRRAFGEHPNNPVKFIDSQMYFIGLVMRTDR